MDGQYKPLSAIEEYVTPLPTMQMEENQESGISRPPTLPSFKSLSGASCDEDPALYLGMAMTQLKLVSH